MNTSKLNIGGLVNKTVQFGALRVLGEPDGRILPPPAPAHG